MITWMKTVHYFVLHTNASKFYLTHPFSPYLALAICHSYSLSLAPSCFLFALSLSLFLSLAPFTTPPPSDSGAHKFVLFFSLSNILRCVSSARWHTAGQEGRLPVNSCSAMACISLGLRIIQIFHNAARNLFLDRRSDNSIAKMHY